MPPRKKFKKKRTARRRFPRRKFRRRRRTPFSSVPNSASPFPKKLFTRLKYVDQLQVNPGASTHIQTWRMNSIFDPDLTNVGHQPLYHDQLGVVYARYRVRGFTYKITLSNFSHISRFSVSPWNNNIPGSITEAAENMMSFQGIISAVTDQRSMKTIKGYVSLKRFLGENLSDDRDQALFGASPANSVNLSLLVESLSGSSITSVNITFELVYHLEVFDKINVAQS